MKDEKQWPLGPTIKLPTPEPERPTPREPVERIAEDRKIQEYLFPERVIYEYYNDGSIVVAIRQDGKDHIYDIPGPSDELLAMTEERDKLKVERDELLHQKQQGIEPMFSRRELLADRDRLAREVEELRARAEAAERGLDAAIHKLATL